ncbi:hypothetical protein AB0I51_25595 [Streptomyces sp. NPDC050549]|uniref:hypothetical protein n=1 Tax=Streptomyces sp. NPDC050549 TaxID=3155406 RepID=UPI00344778BC
MLETQVNGVGAVLILMGVRADGAVERCRLLGLSRGVCVRGPEEGLVLVRSMWRAEVRLAPWDPRFEMTHRRLLPAEEVFRSVTVPDGLGPFYRRLFAEAAVSGPDVHDVHHLWPPDRSRSGRLASTGA